ncbi:MAG: hypothetical protein WC242_00830 [Candidatus Paceibacterota bacterium]|jgi:hypothetical protein
MKKNNKNKNEKKTREEKFLDQYYHRKTSRSPYVVAGIIIFILFIMCLVVMTSLTSARKPAVYLYPEQDSIISVKLNINGKLINDFPKYNNGWKVFATKQGLIDNQYDYLSYEAKLRRLDLPPTGWIVEFNDLEGWLDVNLINLGLNQKEKNQFKEYWLKELPQSNYYEIRLLENSYLEKNMNLVVEPKPDTLIRLNFYLKPLKEIIKIKEPAITTPARNGFTVVEWGGILDD